MKVLFKHLIFAAAAAVTMFSSCSKQTVPVKAVKRTVNFNLYTDKDFSAEDKNITFSIQIHDGTKTLLDSTVAAMKLKDIPDAANKLSYHKVIANTNAELKIGFKYVIENVGYSLHYDLLNPDESHKEFNFSYK